MTTELGRLFDSYGSDKNRNGYTPFYHSILKSMRHKHVDLLEVGIGTLVPGHPSSMVGYSLPGYSPGGSLRAWRDFFPFGCIVGIDVAPDCMFSEDRISTEHADSRDAAALDRILSDRKFDVIVDDGLHAHEAQIQTLMNLITRVRPNGFYVVEDVYPGSLFFEALRWSAVDAILQNVPWFTGPEKNIVVFSL